MGSPTRREVRKGRMGKPILLWILWQSWVGGSGLCFQARYFVSPYILRFAGIAVDTLGVIGESIWKGQ